MDSRKMIMPEMDDEKASREREKWIESKSILGMINACEQGRKTMKIKEGL